MSAPAQNGPHRVCVFCGSSPGASPAFVREAGALGAELAERGMGLVYGGAKVGTMGVIADAALAAGGEVTGVIPTSLVEREVAHDGLTRLEVVASLHERKLRMAELADAFIALPGGMGTLDELFEVVTWAQLGIHTKPIGLVNVDGYFDRLLDHLDHSVEQRFVRAPHRELILVENRPADLLDRMRDYAPATVEKWIDRDPAP